MKKVFGINYIILGIAVFLCFGLELCLAYFIEPVIYGVSISQWTEWQNILHWIMTCILWGMGSFAIVRFAKVRYEFDLFQKGNKMNMQQWLVVIVFVIASLLISYLDWNGSKIIKEFYINGCVKFIFQYMYYIFETFLFMLILIFGQKAFEKWFIKTNIPYGGIVLAVTWGAGHFITKDILTGIVTVIMSLAFGSIYLLVNRDIRKAYPILFIMFVL